MWWTALISVASAQGLPEMNAHLFRPTADAGAFLVTDDASQRALGESEARVLFNRYNGALGATDEDGTDYQVLDTVVAADVVGALHLGALRVGVHVPTFLSVTSDFGAGGAGIGDLGADARFTFLDPADAAFGLAFFGRVTFPTAWHPEAEIALPLGSAGFTGEAGLIGQMPLGEATFAFNLGWRGRPKVETPTLQLNDAVAFRLGVGRALGDTAGLSAELVGAADPGAIGAGGAPVELLGGVWFAVGPVVRLRTAVGTGLTAGLGAPVSRAVLGVSFAPGSGPVEDADGDGLVDARDACLSAPEDFDGFEDEDGCPDPDNDQDGLLDTADACPNAAEDRDGVLDDDGCPEPDTTLTVSVQFGGVDWPGAVIEVAQGDVQHTIGSGGIAVVGPGVWDLRVNPPGLPMIEQRLLITENTPRVQAVELAAPAGTRLVPIQLTNKEGTPLQARLLVGDEWLTVPTALGGWFLPIGESTVTVNAFGYADAAITLEVPESGDVVVERVLFPAWGAVKVFLTTPDGTPISGYWRDEIVGPIPIPVEGLDNFVPEGLTEVTFLAPGYKAKAQSFTVVRDSVAEVVVVLEPQ